MSCRSIMAPALLLGSFVAAGRFCGVAQARTPLEPVQHVYPDSTYAEIQQAIDNGGTVYFERTTQQTNQLTDYNQIASPTPDIPPSGPEEALTRGFLIGKYGKHVDIIGVLGPDGERPRINGGMVPFRAGPFPHLGISGLPVNFRIENLELNNPDMFLPHTFSSRFGIWVVSVLGAQTTIKNCKITITGKETDPNHANNGSAAIWFYLIIIPQQQSLASGTQIDITNNTIIGNRIHDGINVANFWPPSPGFVPPRVSISGNDLQLRNLEGNANRDGVAAVQGIVVAGNFSGTIITNNAVSGEARSPGRTPRIESAAIRLDRTASPGPADQSQTDASLMGNDSSAFASDFQLRLGPNVSGSTIAHNSFGPAGTAGVMCDGRDSGFMNNSFSGEYPGWAPAGEGPGMFWFSEASGGNTVEASKLNGRPEGLDICAQVRDETGGSNKIRGSERCR